MSKKLTTEDFKREVYNLVGDEYTVLGEYTGTNNKILMKHTTCGHEYLIKPTLFKRGRRCPNCYGTPKKDTESFKQEVYSLAGDEYTVLGEYTGTNNKILMKHITCGHTWEVTPNRFLNGGDRCPLCAVKIRVQKRKITPSEFRRQIYNLVGDEYTVLSDYINDGTHVIMKHNVCGYDKWKVLPNNFKENYRCPYCAGNLKRTTESFKQEVCNLVGDEYTVLGEYVNTNNHILMKHNKCGYEYTVRPNDFKQGVRCPKCNESKGEKKISETLDNLKLSYVKEKTFPECKYKRNLKFDFYIESLNLCIEYDGVQHTNVASQFGRTCEAAKNLLETNKLRDNIKDNYCKDSNIALLRISYKDFNNIESILSSYIKTIQ